ncbi:helix-turn-helix domain-containing protein, partial [Gemella haemolysans]
MKLTDENRIEMYRLKKEGYSYKELSKKFEIDPSNVKYMVKLADLHGETVLIKGKNNYYPPELKLDII